MQPAKPLEMQPPQTQTAMPNKESPAPKVSGRRQCSYRHRRLREIMAILSRHEITKGITPVKLRAIIEDLGPTFVKLGQILSMRQDILPKSYCDELEKLRTDVKPLPFATIVSEIEHAYGERAKVLFASIDHTPLGSASIAQVHRAVMRDGTEVAIKVQRPDAYETMAIDMAILERLTGLIQRFSPTGDVIDFKAVLAEIWNTAKQEMDFLIEAQNAEHFAADNAGIAYVGSPKIFHHFTTSRVLMMSDVKGIAIDDIAALTEQGYDLKEIAEKLAENYIKQVIDDAFFHADPHPGNIRIHEGKIIWIDLGMMGTLSRRDCDLFRDAIAAVGTKDVDGFKTMLLNLGEHSQPINHSRLYADLADLMDEYGNINIGEMNLSELMQKALQIAAYHHIAMPRSVTMLARSVMTMEGVIAMLDPDISIIEVMARHVAQKSPLNVDYRQITRHLLHNSAAAGKSALDIPVYLADLLKSTLKGQSKVNLELIGSEEPLKKVERMVNRLVTAIITAALLIGSSFIATTRMKPTFMGIPLLGFIGFFAAIILGSTTLISIYRSQRKRKKRRF